MDTMSFMTILAVSLPLLGLAACVTLWQRWKAPWPAKLMICIGILVLLVPGTCFVVAAAGEKTGLLRTGHF